MGERKYLTSDEVSELLDVSKMGRHGHRNFAMVLTAFKHGLRCSELCDLRWSDIDWERGRILARRLKSGRSATHPLSPAVKDALQSLKQFQPASEWVFTSQQGGKLGRQSFNRILKEIAGRCEIAINVTPKCLRHAAGFSLADRGLDTRRIQEFLGHRDISSTQVYVDLAAKALDNVYV